MAGFFYPPTQKKATVLPVDEYVRRSGIIDVS